MRNIAILHNHRANTFEWLTETLKETEQRVIRIDRMHETVDTLDTRYYLINSKEKALGISWDGYIISPFYSDLRMELDARTRQIEIGK